MAGERQRFCPVCDRALIGGEAVLRCGVCGLLHHPGCWVKNGGCNAGCVGAEQPEPLAYDMAGPPVFPHPGEGTRVAPRATGAPLPGAIARPDPVERVGPEPQPGEPRQRSVPQAPAPVPGRARPIVEHGRQESEPRVIEPPPRAQRGRMPGGGSRPPVDDLRLYRRHELLRYWYVPVAASLAVLVAVGVIWGADKIFGGGSDPASPTATATPSASTTASVTTTGTPATSTPGTRTPATATGSPPAGTPTPGSNGATGQLRTVGGTGGDCLNIRTGPGTASPAVDCLDEGTVVELAGETEESGGITWVRIHTESGHDGWVAEEYLQPQ